MTRVSIDGRLNLDALNEQLEEHYLQAGPLHGNAGQRPALHGTDAGEANHSAWRVFPWAGLGILVSMIAPQTGGSS